MCGRYYSRGDKQRIADAFKVGKMPPGYHLPADYNIAPSTFQPVILPDRETGDRELVPMRWDLVPAKIADPKAFKIYTTSNARAESILDKPIWRGPFLHTRCLIPIDGFYERLQRPASLSHLQLSPANRACFQERHHRR